MRLLIFLLPLLSLCSTLSADEFSVTDANGNDISIDSRQASGDLLMIWLVDHEEPRALFDELLQKLTESGIEIWRVDLLQAYFLPRSSETVRTLDGEGVSALLSAAHARSDKRILLASYDRMPLPLLRGVNRWQAGETESRLLGAILFYPNLFGPAPAAGEAPVLDPILQATNLPLVIFQPDLGSQRWRLLPVVTTLWRAGSPTYVYLVPGVRDWFIMGDQTPDEQQRKAVANLPRQIAHFARLLHSHPKPQANIPARGSVIPMGDLHTLIPATEIRPAPPLNLVDSKGVRLDLESLKDRVVLVNFWATWCPPCVEEIPSLNRLQAHYRGQNIEIISVDYRESAKEIGEFLKSRPVDFPVLMDSDGLVSLEWQVFSFPSSFIIDTEGRIRYTANRALNWDSQEVIEVIDTLLAE
ncbi:MAG: TlpA disulfide reductase family protein [Candidatus Thiodiazotropha sp.]